MEVKKKKHKYPTDTEAGIRTITAIRSLPSGQLTDEEFVKEFFDRFEAKALIMIYTNEQGENYSFGRLKKGTQVFEYYRRLKGWLDQAFSSDRTDFKEIE